MRRILSLVLALTAIVFVATHGTSTLARLAWLVRMPNLTCALSSDPGVCAAALFQMRRYAEADEAFAKIGRGATYNRAATLAATGEYALSVAYYDAVLFADRWDSEARANRDLVDTLVEPVVGEARGHGRIGAMLSEAGANVAAFDTHDPTAPTVTLGVNHRRPTDARAVRADEDWLDTLSDAPGEYLSRRIAAEYDRRVEQGLAHPQERSPW